MRIGYDVRPFLREETGVGVYFKNLLFALAGMDRTNEYYLFSSSMKDRFIPAKIPRFEKGRFRDFRYPVKAVDFLWHRLGWPPLDFFFHVRLDLAHSPTPLVLPARGKKIVTVYDLFFLDFPRISDRMARKDFARGIRDSLGRCDGVLTISRFTEEQLRERFGLEAEKVRIIPPGVHRDFWRPADALSAERTRQRHGLPRDFLLFVGALEPRKNLPRLLQALKVVHQSFARVSLVLAGREGRDAGVVRARTRELGLETWVKITGYLEADELRDLYHSASAFVFPSLGEGFGIPLLEAMASGVPVVSSRAPALPETAGEAAEYFDPLDGEDMARAIVRVLDDGDLRERLVSSGLRRVKGFTWERAAAQALDFYRSVTNS